MRIHTIATKNPTKHSTIRPECLRSSKIQNANVPMQSPPASATSGYHQTKSSPVQNRQVEPSERWMRVHRESDLLSKAVTQNTGPKVHCIAVNHRVSTSAWTSSLADEIVKVPFLGVTGASTASGVPARDPLCSKKLSPAANVNFDNALCRPSATEGVCTGVVEIQGEGISAPVIALAATCGSTRLCKAFAANSRRIRASFDVRG